MYRLQILKHLSTSGPARDQGVVLLLAVAPDCTAAADEPGRWDSLDQNT
jgi:hypothetical protein